MERSHSTSNDLNRKLRPISEVEAKLKRKMVEMVVKASVARKKAAPPPSDIPIHKR